MIVAAEISGAALARLVWLTLPEADSVAAVDARAELAKNGKVWEHNPEARIHSAEAMVDSGERTVDGVGTMADGRETVIDGLGRLVVGVTMLIADAEHRLSSHCMAAAAGSVSGPERPSRMGAKKWPGPGEVATGAAWHGIEMGTGVRGQVSGNDSLSISHRPPLIQKHQMWAYALEQASRTDSSSTEPSPSPSRKPRMRATQSARFGHCGWRRRHMVRNMMRMTRLTRLRMSAPPRAAAQAAPEDRSLRSSDKSCRSLDAWKMRGDYGTRRGGDERGLPKWMLWILWMCCCQ